jgi:hypothetical protein
MVILRNRRHKRYSENRVAITLFKGEITFMKEIFICKGVSLCVRKRRMDE